MTGNEKTILTVTAAAHFLTHFSMLAFPAMVMPLSRELGIPVGEVINLSFWMYLLYGLLALGWGWLADTKGHKIALGTGMTIAGTGLLCAGIIPDIRILPGAFALVGAGFSAFHPSGVALVSRGVKERGRAFGILGIWGNAGMAAVPFAVGLFNLLIGWRGGLVFTGAITIILGISIFFVRYTIKHSEDETEISPIDDKTAVKLTIVFFCVLVFSGMLFRSYTVTLPAFLEAKLGDAEGLFGFSNKNSALSTLAANSVATAVYVIAIFGQWVGGKITDRFSLKHAYPAFFICALPFLGAHLIIPGAGIIPAAGFYVFFILGMQPVENSLVAYITPSKWRSIGYGLKFTVGFGIGSLAVKIASIIEGRFGLDGVMKANLVYLAGAILASLFFIIVSRGVEIRHGSKEKV